MREAQAGLLADISRVFIDVMVVPMHSCVTTRLVLRVLVLLPLTNRFSQSCQTVTKPPLQLGRCANSHDLARFSTGAVFVKSSRSAF